MNLSSESGDRQAVNEAVNGAIHLAAMNGLTLLEMRSLNLDKAADAKPVRRTDEAGMKLAGEWISRTDDVRFELVSALRARILAGTYQVGAEDVAEKLMGTMRG